MPIWKVRASSGLRDSNQLLLHDNSALRAMKFIANFRKSKRGIKSLGRDRRGYAQHLMPVIGSHAFQMHHQSLSNPGPLVVRIDEDTSDDILVKTRRGNDIVIDHCYIYISLCDQPHDLGRGKALRYLADHLWRIVSRIGFTQRRNDNFADPSCVGTRRVTNKIGHLDFLVEGRKSTRQFSRYAGHDRVNDRAGVLRQLCIASILPSPILDRLRRVPCNGRRSRTMQGFAMNHTPPSGRGDFIRALVFVPLGLFLLYITFCQVNDRLDFLAQAQRAQGHVSALNAGGSHPQIDFTDATGHAVSYAESGLIFGYSVGDAVTVFYRTEASEKTAIIGDRGALWGTSLLASVFAVVFTAGGGYHLVAWIRRRRVARP
jgi:hypothetical protein